MNIVSFKISYLYFNYIYECRYVLVNAPQQTHNAMWIFVVVVSQDRMSLCRRLCPWTHSIDQAPCWPDIWDLCVTKLFVCLFHMSLSLSVPLSVCVCVYLPRHALQCMFITSHLSWVVGFIGFEFMFAEWVVNTLTYWTAPQPKTSNWNEAAIFWFIAFTHTFKETEHSRSDTKRFLCITVASTMKTSRICHSGVYRVCEMGKWYWILGSLGNVTQS